MTMCSTHKKENRAVLVSFMSCLGIGLVCMIVEQLRPGGPRWGATSAGAGLIGLSLRSTGRARDRLLIAVMGAALILEDTWTR